MRLQVVVVEQHQSLLDVTCPQPTSTTSNPNKLAAALPSLQHHRRRQDHTDVSSSEASMQRPVADPGGQGEHMPLAPKRLQKQISGQIDRLLRFW